MVAGKLVVGRRFQGYPRLGQGGYLAGILATGLPGPVRVSFRSPIPIETELEVEDTPRGRTVWHGPSLVAEAEVGEEPGAPPPPVAPAAAEAAGRGAPSLPIVDGCFSCGIGKDSLGARCGPTGEGAVATLWIPPAWSAGGGIVHSPFVWAALDCAGFWRLATEPEFPNPVTARLTVALSSPVEIGEPYVLVADAGEDWAGRKRVVRSALYAAGELVAVSEALWVRPRLPG